jgi:hypothetical protein
LIAVSAAARLVHSILARLDTPHAAPAMRPLSAGELWKQVARRLGYPAQEPQAGHFQGAASPPGHSNVALPAQQRASVPPVSLAWRARAVAQHPGEEHSVTAWKPQPSALMRPAIQIVGQPVPVPTTSAPVEPSVKVAPLTASESGPPRAEPATVIRIEYVPVPLVAQLQPLLPVPQTIGQHAVRERLAGPGAHRLASQVNRDLVPTTDLLSRMVHTPNAQVTPVQPRPGTTPTTPSISSEAHTLTMPLATPAARTVEAAPSEAGLTAASPLPRGPLGRLMDRLSSAIPVPHAIRRALGRERSSTESATHPEQPAAPHLQFASPRSEASSEGITAQVVVVQPVADTHIEATPDHLTQVATAEQIQAQPRALAPLEAIAPEPYTETGRAHAKEEHAPSQQVSRESGSLVNTWLARLLGGETSGSSERRTPLNMPWARPASRRESSGDALTVTEIADRVLHETPAPVAAQTNVASPVQVDVARVPESQDYSEQPPILPQHRARAVDVPAPLLPDVPVSALPGPPVLPKLDHSELAQDESTEIEGTEVWREMSEVASEVARLHEPIGTVPSGSVSSDSFVSRILRRIGTARADVSVQGLLDRLGKPTMSEASAHIASAAVPVDGGNRVYRALWHGASPVEVPGQSQQFTGTSGSLPSAGLTGWQALRLAPGPLEIGRAPGRPITSRISAFGGVLRSVTNMSPSLAYLPPQANAEEDAGSGLDDYMIALEQLFGSDERADAMPLAVPFGSYVAPSERPAYFAGERSDEISGAESVTDDHLPLDAFDGFREPPSLSTFMPMPALSSFQVGESAPDGYISNYSWGDASDDRSFHAEASAWADVVSSAVGGGQPAGAPALALAGSERSSESGPQRPPNEDKAASPNLDDLADTVYSLIRERLAIEKERSFA